MTTALAASADLGLFEAAALAGLQPRLGAARRLLGTGLAEAEPG